MTFLSKFAIFTKKWFKIAAQKNVDLSNQNYKVNMDFTKIFIYMRSPLTRRLKPFSQCSVSSRDEKVLAKQLRRFKVNRKISQICCYLESFQTKCITLTILTTECLVWTLKSNK